MNSTVTVTELANRVRTTHGALAHVAFRGVVLATAAMVVRNGLILALLAPATLSRAAMPLILMLAGALGAARFQPDRSAAQGDSLRNSGAPTLPTLHSPFSLTAALKFGLVFLALQVAGTLSQRALGTLGFYAVSVAGGVVSSASAVASAASLAASGTLSGGTAATGAVIATAASAIVDLPIVARVGRNRELTRKVAVALAATLLLGAAGVVLQHAFDAW